MEGLVGGDVDGVGEEVLVDSGADGGVVVLDGQVDEYHVHLDHVDAAVLLAVRDELQDAPQLIHYHFELVLVTHLTALL